MRKRKIHVENHEKMEKKNEEKCELKRKW